MPSKKISLAERMTVATYRRVDAAGPRCGVCLLAPEIREAVETEMRKPKTYKPWVALEFIKESGCRGVTESVLAYHRRTHLNDPNQ